MAQSNLMKVVGKIGGEVVTIEGRLRDSGWALIMPESAQDVSGSPSTTPSSPLTNMMRWVTGFHDAFGLYGRPGRYIWDKEDPKSLFFGYPQQGQRSVSNAVFQSD
jgi:CCR4-NOT transcriptional complex subunit CAF120